MAVVMLVLLTTILGTIALASRNTSGLLAVRSQSSNREARDIAESGVTEIISELNKEPNRTLLILPTANWGSDKTNPCSALDSTGAAVSIIPTPTTKALNFASNNWVSLTSGDSTKQFKLDSAVATTTARTALGSTLATNQLQGLEKTLFKLTVTGRVRDAAGNVLSTATISREYEVVPKCCKRSFGRNASAATIYGDDRRACYASGSGGLGIVVSLQGGSIEGSSNIFNIFGPNGTTPITKVLCAQGNGNTKCDDGDLQLGASISVVPTSFSTPFPAYPGIKSAATIIASASPPSNSYFHIRINSAGNGVEQCRSDGITCNSLSSGPGTPCEIISGQAWCRLESINAQQAGLKVDTTRGKINFYFTGTASEYINLSGSSAITHVRCPSFSATCANNATLADVENFNIFIAGNGNLGLRGTASALAINVWNQSGKTTLLGNATLIGRIWTNTLKATGNLMMTVPDSAPTQFCPSISTCPPQAGGSPSTDWVARSITQSSNF